MSLVPYTNTYTDVDGSIADSDDIVAEFDRVALFINAWIDSYELIGLTDVHVYNVTADGSQTVNPAKGLVQAMHIDANVSLANINIKERASTDPYRLYLTLRFGSKSTQFTVSAPAGKSNVFGINQTPFSPSQVAYRGRYAATVIVTYGTEGTHVQVYADNAEADSVGIDDILQGVGV
jgi:hypothetical protein